MKVFFWHQLAFRGIVWVVPVLFFWVPKFVIIYNKRISGILVNQLSQITLLLESLIGSTNRSTQAHGELSHAEDPPGCLLTYISKLVVKYVLESIRAYILRQHLFGLLKVCQPKGHFPRNVFNFSSIVTFWSGV